MDEVGIFVEQSGYKFLLYEEYEENKYNLIKSAEKYFHFRSRSKEANYLFIVEPTTNGKESALE